MRRLTCSSPVTDLHYMWYQKKEGKAIHIKSIYMDREWESGIYIYREEKIIKDRVGQIER